MEKGPADIESISAMESQIEELTDDLKRVQADFENYKKRVQKERDERSKAAALGLMTDLLGVLDSFDKALEDSAQTENPRALRNGLEGLRRQLLQVLQREGLRETRADGKFDPFLHEALMREERDDVEDGSILEVYLKGYQVGTTPIRPARVKVARKKAPDGESERDEVQVTQSARSHTEEDEERGE